MKLTEEEKIRAELDAWYERDTGRKLGSFEDEIWARNLILKTLTEKDWKELHAEMPELDCPKCMLDLSKMWQKEAEN